MPDEVTEAEFEAMVVAAIDNLPDQFREELDKVPVVISDQGRERHAYGLYWGDGIARDNWPDRIVIFRDTLTRDFGHDRELLAAQVERTVRHELGHHFGFHERGVRDLGL
ncbi:MAG: metallopeptidase family protein [Solirubrobacterales bacterium]|nr:metallopeptidase family protein [Solirubrobacterales bacterium]